MHTVGYTLYVIIGSILGMSYGLLFLLQKRGALSYTIDCSEPENQRWIKTGMISNFLWTLLRLLLLAVVWFYLLPLSTIPFIMVLISFFVFFGLVIYYGTGVLS